MAEPLLRTLDGIAEPAHLVGHSYGGAVALHLARTRPWLFRSLTLIEPSAFHLLHGTRLAEISAVAARVRADLGRGDAMDGYGRFIDYWGGAGSWTAIPEDRRAALAARLGDIALEFDALLDEPAGLEDYRDIRMPTLLLQGGGTKLPSRAICRRLRATLPATRFRVVHGAGHMLPFTHREAVNAALAEHIDSNSTVTTKEAA